MHHGARETQNKILAEIESIQDLIPGILKRFNDIDANIRNPDLCQIACARGGQSLAQLETALERLRRIVQVDMEINLQGLEKARSRRQNR
jgi:hypothetical protein